MRKKKYLIAIIIISFLTFLYFFLPDDKHTYRINKTVGWAWDISNYIPYIAGIVFIIILIIAIILWAGKK